MSVPAASIGAVRLVPSTHASATSTASVPLWATPAEHMDSLFVALRIDNFTLSAALAESKGD
jgi:hypothetical protein